MEEPDRSPKVMKILEVLAKAERDQRVMANVDERLREVGFVELRSPADGEVWQLSAQGVDQEGRCLGKVQLRRRSEDLTRSLSASTASIQVTDAGVSTSRGMQQWLGRADAAETGIRLHLPQAKVGQEPEAREVFLNDLQLTSVDLQAPVLTWQAIKPRMASVDASTRRLLERVVDRTFRIHFEPMVPCGHARHFAGSYVVRRDLGPAHEGAAIAFGVVGGLHASPVFHAFGCGGSQRGSYRSRQRDLDHVGGTSLATRLWWSGGRPESTGMKFFLPPLIRRTVRARFLGNFVLLFGLLFLLATSIDTLLTFHEYLEVTSGEGIQRFIQAFGFVIDFQLPRLFQLYALLWSPAVVGAAGFTFVRMQRHREIVGLQAAGISRRSLMRPIVEGTLILIVLQGLNQEFMVPKLSPLLARTHGDIGQDAIRALQFPLQMALVGFGVLGLVIRSEAAWPTSWCSSETKLGEQFDASKQPPQLGMRTGCGN